MKPTAGPVPFSALLLAGGRSTRMGYDKAMIETGGVPLWERQLDTLRALQPDQLFVSAALQAKLPDLRVRPIKDLVPGAGPLAGIAAGLRCCAAPLLLVLAVDMPSISTAFLRQLLERADHHRGVVPRVGTLLEPLAAVYTTRCLSIAESCLERRVLKMQTFAQLAVHRGAMEVYAVPSEQEALFVNLNSAADVARFEQALLP